VNVFCLSGVFPVNVSAFAQIDEGKRGDGANRNGKYRLLIGFPVEEQGRLKTDAAHFL